MKLSNYSKNVAANSVEFESEKKYWLEKLKGDIEMSGFATNNVYDKPAKLISNNYQLKIDGNIYDGIMTMSQHSSYAVLMILISGVEFLLSRYNNNEDIIIGMPVFKQSGNLSYVNNILALRNNLRTNINFKELVKDIKSTISEAQENQNFPLSKIVELLNIKSKPIFKTMVLLKNIQNESDVEDIESDIRFMFELNNNYISLDIEYNSNLFVQDFIKQLGKHLLIYYNAVVNDPDICLCNINILDEQEENTIMGFNNNFKNIPNTTVIDMFKDKVKLNPDKIAIVYENQKLTYGQLDYKSNQLANYLIEVRKVLLEEKVGILIENSLDQIVAVIGTLKAGAAYVPIDTELPEERIKVIINDSNIRTVISSKNYIRKLNRLQWECAKMDTYICIDTKRIHDIEEEKHSDLMNKNLWEFVGENSVDEITGGGWKDSYTGKDFTKCEMDEYGDNILKKLLPYLDKSKKVLEIGCASGISMYRIAPLVSKYYGTDLSESIINVNKKRIENENIPNIKLKSLPAHKIDEIGEDSFDIVILNSVIQCFHGHNYLRKVLRKAINLLKDNGIIFVGDVMDQELKQQFIESVCNFKKNNLLKKYRTKTDWSEELFLSKGYFKDLKHDFCEIEDVKFSSKICTIENELTKYRYDCIMVINKKNSNKAKLSSRIKYQDDLNTLMKCSYKEPDLKISPKSIAYMIYTSGTTGTPKGVMIRHEALVNLCLWNNDYYNVTQDDNTTRYASFGFDASVWELFPALVAGATIHVISPKIRLDIDKLNKYFEKNNITISFLPTQICEQFQKMNNTSLRYLLTGGDKLKVYSNNKFKLSNNYGPTENTVVTTSFIVENESNNIPIGKPISNVRVYILNKNNKMQPLWAKGELCISGIGLAKGYLNNEKLTEEKFIKNPFDENSMIYKTGDLASWMPDGNIQFFGRNDQQVKIRGCRIEISDIENKINKCEYIKEAVVIARNDDNNKYLCAYYVSDKELELDYLRGYLSTQLPEYMIPSFFVKIDKLPLNSNGKINRGQLPEPFINRKNEFIPPNSEIEKSIAKSWSEILNINKISMNDNFFDLGGNSLKAIRVVSKMSADFEVSINDIFNYQTIAELSKTVTYKKDNFNNKIKKVREMYTSNVIDEYPLNYKQKLDEYEKSLDDYKNIENIDEKNDYKNILLVGATGFLGINILNELLKNTKSNIVLLVRANSINEAKKRIAQKSEHQFNTNIIENHTSRIQILCGDLLKEKFGLTHEEYNELSLKIDCIINSAAKVSHYVKYIDFYEINVHAVERLIEFALEGKRKVFNHVSTVGVASGKINDIKNFVFTENDSDVGQISNNYYTKTKIEAEKKILEANKRGLNFNIFRVGHLICDSKTGIFQENINDNGFYKTIKSLIHLEKMPNEFIRKPDFSFIDCVSRAIVLLMNVKKLNNGIYHIFNHNDIEPSYLVELLKKCDINIDLMNIDEFLDYLCEKLNDSEKAEYAENIILYSQMFNALEDTKFNILSNKTVLLLNKLGFEWPEANIDNISKLITYCRKVKFI